MFENVVYKKALIFTNVTEIQIYEYMIISKAQVLLMVQANRMRKNNFFFEEKRL
jgi:hypothetical protein